MPEVSIIIPTFNRAALLPDTVASARLAGSDVEIIVVDDASTDETPRLCRQMTGVKYLRLERNSGTSHARNVAIRESSCEFVAFLDDDDLRLPDTMDRQLEVLKASPDAALVYGRAFLGDPRFSLPTGRLIPEDCPVGDVYWPLLEANFVTMSTVVARKRCLIDAGLFDTTLDTLEDYELWIRVAERYPMEAVEEPVAVYRMRSESSGQKTSDRAYHDRHHKMIHAGLLRSMRALAAPRRQRRRIHRRHMNVIYSSLIHDAAGALLNGDTASAQAFLWAAVRLNPRHVKAHGSLLWLLARHLLQKLN